MMEVYRKAPDQALAILRSPMGEVTKGYNGAVAWEFRPGRGVRDETSEERLHVEK